jgi:hypothetical protein
VRRRSAGLAWLDRPHPARCSRPSLINSLTVLGTSAGAERFLGPGAVISPIARVSPRL